MAAEVTSERHLAGFYRRVGVHARAGGRAWDSAAAMETGAVVRRELRDTPMTIVAAVLEPLSVAGWPAWYRRQMARAGA